MSLFNSLVLWIEDHLSDPDLSAEVLATAHFLSPRYVRRIFAVNGSVARETCWDTVANTSS